MNGHTTESTDAPDNLKKRARAASRGDTSYPSTVPAAQEDDFNAGHDPYMTQKNIKNVADPFVTTKGTSRGRQSIAASGEESIPNQRKANRTARRSVAVPPSEQTNDEWA